MSDLRTLAQAVVDAHAAWSDTYDAHQQERVAVAHEALTKALGPLYDADTAKRILAALDAAEAQGYARAMGEVVERCDAEAGAFGTGRASDHYARALDDTADWADARLLAAAERD